MNGRDLLLSSALDESEISHFLKQFGFQDPAGADQCIQKMVDITGDPFLLSNITDRLLEALANSADPDSAIKGLVTFFEALPNLSQFIHVSMENPAILEVAATVAGGSEFLTLILLRNPRYIYWLMEKGNLQLRREPDYFKIEASRVLEITPDIKSCLEALQRFQRREILRIGTQDLLRILPMSDIAHQISSLADAVLQVTLEITAREYDALPFGFAVLGMGKLGGRELNFSSDVDLIFLYKNDGSRRQVLKFSKAYRKALTESAPEGHFYRVDLRLRPMGTGGDMATSLKAADNYYRHWADTTDRLAMIKARPVAGDLEMGGRFILSLQDFIYKKYQDFAAVEEIRLIKQRTDRELKRRDQLQSDIKLGLGGIREIEFFVQSFQLLYGGLNPGIRSGNTLKALDLLVDNGFIDSKDHLFLKESYIFLRDLEHKLQLVSYLQTQSLPQEDSELLFCARRMGYRSEKQDDPAEAKAVIVDIFNTDLNRITTGVNRIFASLLQGESIHSELADILLDKEISESAAQEKINKSYAPRNPEGVLEGVRILGNARAFPHSPQKMRNLLANLLPFLLEKSSVLPEPRELFIRLDRFAEALGGRVTLYSEMAGNLAQADAILDILSSGPFLSERLIQRPELTDYIMTAHSTEPDYYRLLEESIKISVSHGRSFEDALRFFKQSEEFKLGVRELPDPGSSIVRRQLSVLAEACLNRTSEELLDRFPAIREIPFSIAALGKLGGSELIFHSDLDLLFVYDNKSGDGETVQNLLSFVRSMNHTLQEYTQYGKVYSLDFRLRPEGRNAAYIISLDQLVEYFATRAETWERLAYVKLRSIVDHGCPLPFPELLEGTGLDEKQTAELLHIRHRKELELSKEKSSGERDFKIGYGGLLDTQFYVQMLQLKNNVFEPNTMSSLDKLSDKKIISSEDRDSIQEIVRFFYALESVADLTSTPGETNPRLSENAPHTENIARLLGYSSPAALLETYEKLAEKNRKFLETLGNP
ncbi:MAG: hypothetical protein ABIJ42_04055 [Acidobacteriota bacterium]